jgi:hypothetical protein
MSTFDRQAMIERQDREYDECVEKMRIRHKGEMLPIVGLLVLGIFCMSLGFMLGRLI